MCGGFVPLWNGSLPPRLSPGVCGPTNIPKTTNPTAPTFLKTWCFSRVFCDFVILAPCGKTCRAPLWGGPPPRRRGASPERGRSPVPPCAPHNGWRSHQEVRGMGGIVSRKEPTTVPFAACVLSPNHESIRNRGFFDRKPPMWHLTDRKRTPWGRESRGSATGSTPPPK